MTSAAPSLKRVAVCVDDYAQHRAIDAAALALLARGRISAISVLALSPRWPRAARALREVAGRHVDIGLHLDLTSPVFRQRWALPLLIGRAGLRLLDRLKLREVIARQFDRFESALGRAPDYLDGHQHVHQLPQVRELWMLEAEQRYGGVGWVRSTLPADPQPKARLVYALGGGGLLQALAQRGWRHNTRLAGVYGFTPDRERYAQRLRQWFAQLPDGGLLMCHPAAGLADNDPHPAARSSEFEVLMDGRFDEALRTSGATLVRLSTLAMPA